MKEDNVPQQREVIDISNFANEVGINIPVFVTPALWSTYIEPEQVISVGQTKSGRIWGMLMMLMEHIMSRVLVDPVTIQYSVHFVIDGMLTSVSLKATIQKEAIGKAVIYIMLPDERIEM